MTGRRGVWAEKTGQTEAVAATQSATDTWVPTDGWSQVNEDEHSRYSYQYFGWATANSMSHFAQGNHTFEHETHYDGYDLVSCGFQNWFTCHHVYADDTTGAWNSNLPNAYLDTTFLDNAEEPNLVVGTADATKLQANLWYWYWVRTQVSGSGSVKAPSDWTHYWPLSDASTLP